MIFFHIELTIIVFFPISDIKSNTYRQISYQQEQFRNSFFHVIKWLNVLWKNWFTHKFKNCIITFKTWAYRFHSYEYVDLHMKKYNGSMCLVCHVMCFIVIEICEFKWQLYAVQCKREAKQFTPNRSSPTINWNMHSICVNYTFFWKMKRIKKW